MVRFRNKAEAFSVRREYFGFFAIGFLLQAKGKCVFDAIAGQVYLDGCMKFSASFPMKNFLRRLQC